jgi:hypothetical protein
LLHTFASALFVWTLHEACASSFSLYQNKCIITCRSTVILQGSVSQKTTLNIILAAVRTWNLALGSLFSSDPVCSVQGLYSLSCRSNLGWQVLGNHEPVMKYDLDIELYRRLAYFVIRMKRKTAGAVNDQEFESTFLVNSCLQHVRN